MKEQTEQNDNQSLSNKPVLNGSNKLSFRKIDFVKINDFVKASKVFNNLKPIISLNNWQERYKIYKQWINISNEKETEYKRLVVVFRSKYEKEYGFRIISNYFIDWLDSRFSIIDFCGLKEHDILYQLHEYCKQLRNKYDCAEHNQVIEKDTTIILENSRKDILVYDEYTRIFESEKHRLICEEVLIKLEWIESVTLISKKSEKEKSRFLVFAKYIIDKNYVKQELKENKILPVITHVYCGKPSKYLELPYNHLNLKDKIDDKFNTVLSEK